MSHHLESSASILGALYLLTRNINGVEDTEAAKMGPNVHCSILDLVDKGYAKRHNVGKEDSTNYILTTKGEELIKKIAKNALDNLV